MGTVTCEYKNDHGQDPSPACSSQPTKVCLSITLWTCYIHVLHSLHVLGLATDTVGLRIYPEELVVTVNSIFITASTV
jgi:hypothetical protein